ncbi:MAG TPA: hypothetical protein VN027_18100, partial [Isoptericola sp.]|nr:hypothetical protein [Isoptericola sp.]
MSGASTTGPVEDPSHRYGPAHRSPVPGDAAPPTGPLQALLGGDASDHGTATDLVRVVDTPEARVRHPSDMLGMVVSAL